MTKTNNEPAQFSIIDRDSGERMSSKLFSTRDGAERERNRLALRYGKLFCLGIGQLSNAAVDLDVTEAK